MGASEGFSEAKPVSEDIYDYCNSKVKQIWGELQPYQIPGLKDGKRVESRGVQNLENEAHYLGEWSGNQRHGKGV